jgi:hypothetical protein
VSLLVARQVIVRVELVSVLLFVGGLSFKVGSFEVEEAMEVWLGAFGGVAGQFNRAVPGLWSPSQLRTSATNGRWG